jgi:heme/copper-type cytochrome/quinol oxidase subunit 2
MQCSQLCGLAHSTMTMPVRVVTDAEFQAWVARNKG